MIEPDRKNLVSIAKLANMLDLSVMTIRRRIADGSIAAIQLGGPGKKILVDLNQVLGSLGQGVAAQKAEKSKPYSADETAGVVRDSPVRRGPKPRWMRK
jgi:hypothetical protein